MILGIDEVGRGPWAGPLVVGAVVLGGAVIEGLTDSKKLTKKRRVALDEEIREKAAGIGLGWVSAEEIDEIGLGPALRLATKRAVQDVDASFHEIIIDGTINLLAETPLESHVSTMPKADLLVPSVSAASIIAKVARDAYMTKMDDEYPGYRFSSHAGYGTAAHRAAIEQLGVTPLHRLSFAPLQKYKDATHVPTTLQVSSYSSKATGDAAEEIVATFLKRAGHEIKTRNWKTKYCEIDIVSQRAETVYFTEVKYRSQENQGGGIAAITPKKLQQMRFAAELYVYTHSIKDTTLKLSVAAVSGSPPEITEYLEEV